MTARVKICGINSPAAFDAAQEADWIGFVFFPPSPRFVTLSEAARLSARAQGGPARVGLFVEPSDAEVTATLDALQLDALQIYAPPLRAVELRVRFGVPVWYAIGVERADDLPAAALGLDALLLDAKPAPNAAQPGGNAESFDWTILRTWAAPAPWLLAGGLTPHNVAEALRASGAPAVDVSSGVEGARGVKDPALIRAFMRAARGGFP